MGGAASSPASKTRKLIRNARSQVPVGVGACARYMHAHASALPATHRRWQCAGRAGLGLGPNGRRGAGLLDAHGPGGVAITGPVPSRIACAKAAGHPDLRGSARCAGVAWHHRPSCRPGPTAAAMYRTPRAVHCVWILLHEPGQRPFCLFRHVLGSSAITQQGTSPEYLYTVAGMCTRLGLLL